MPIYPISLQSILILLSRLHPGLVVSFLLAFPVNSYSKTAPEQLDFGKGEVSDNCSQTPQHFYPQTSFPFYPTIRRHGREDPCERLQEHATALGVPYWLWHI